MTRRPLTDVAQQALATVLHNGDLVVDATVGNGHDTLFLARSVAPNGRVVGFDIQRQALDAARARLKQAGLDRLVGLQLCGHQHLAAELPAAWHGRVAAVMFNLGYLPGADKSVITGAATTLAALRQAGEVVRIGGLVSLMVYRAHSGAAAEADAIAAWLATPGTRYRVTTHESPGPVLHLLQRLR